MTKHAKTTSAKRSAKTATKKAVAKKNKPVAIAAAATLPPPIEIPLSKLVELPERNARRTRLDNVNVETALAMIPSPMEPIAVHGKW
ncbi:MAG: hypothetical protein LC098_04045 [Burkholderiales bacterium]|nr:hypothetical protein [Burkholderiales bacterium]